MPNILLIPTPMECSVVEPYLRTRLPQLWDRADGKVSWQVELCGFGLVAAGASAAKALAIHQPRSVLLVGIAGSLNISYPPGTAITFNRVTCHGIGVGDSLSELHQSPDQLGWKHCEASSEHDAIGDSIWLSDVRSSRAYSGGQHLISVTAASADANEASLRKRRFPDADAEDMEGFGVALACAIAAKPLRIVRGISNFAGDRNHSSWKIQSALMAAAEMACHIIGTDIEA